MYHLYPYLWANEPGKVNDVYQCIKMFQLRQNEVEEYMTFEKTTAATTTTTNNNNSSRSASSKMIETLSHTVSAHGSRGRTPWHRIHGQMVSRVGMTRWNLLNLFLARTFLWRIIVTDCHMKPTSPSCCLPKMRVERERIYTWLESSLNHRWQKWRNMR